MRSTAADFPPEYAVVLNNEGIAALNKGDWSLAIDKLTAAVVVNPKYLLARENLAVVHNNYGLYLRNRNKREAFKQFHEAVYLMQGPVNLANLRGMTRVIGKNPDSSIDHVQLGDKARAEGDLVSGVVEYRAALKLKDDPQVRKKLEEVNRLLVQQTETKSKQIQQLLANSRHLRKAIPNIDGNVNKNSKTSKILE